MDKTAVNNASDKDLKELGLIAKGDIIALRAFCYKQKPETTERIEELKQAVQGNNCLKQIHSKIKQKTIHMGWLHFRPDANKFVLVKAIRGGSSRSLKVNETCTNDELLEL